MQQVLDFHNVTVRRGAREILRDVTWQVVDRDRWVVLGANGAGKTTLLKVAAAELHPTSGTAWVLGERLGAVDVFDLRPRIGFASAALAERLPRGESVLDCVVTGAFGVTGRWNQRFTEVDVVRAQQLLAMFGLSKFAARTFGTLSEGERKRVQLCRALMANPELLLLDEPTAGLDLGGREELMAALTTLARDEKAPVMILVTHRIEEIPAGFDHALVMRDGGVEAAGPIQDVLTEPVLSAAFGLPLRLTQTDGRYAAISAWRA